MIYDHFEQHFEDLAPPEIPRVEVINELHGAIFDGRPILHGGEWAMATMEVCFALLQSSREGREISLRHQTGLPAGL
jgi:phthalate 4,5-cis-dihydrodiol dehydrogenase